MSKRELVLKAVAALISAALPDAGFERNQAKADEVGPNGSIVMRDGDPGPPEIDLSPLSYNYDHSIPLEIAVLPSDEQTNEQALDAMLSALGAAVAADRTLGGLCDFLDVEAPTTEELVVEGAPAGRWADLAIVASYATPNPLT